MAEAGWPLRRETFYYSHRKGGLQVLPFDVEAELSKVLPEARPGDWEYLSKNDYELGLGGEGGAGSRELRRAGAAEVRDLQRSASRCSA